MILKKLVIKRIALTVYTCACIFMIAASASLAYTNADVKRGEDFLAIKDYKKAIELLSSITKDMDFCTANSVDAARAGMALCDAFEANSEKGSEACKAAAESTKLALVQVWASLKKTEPDVKKRLEKVAEICKGHPQAFAEFLKPMLPRLIATCPKSDAPVYLGSVCSLYKAALSAPQSGQVEMDVDLLFLIAGGYREVAGYKQSICILEEVLPLIIEKKPDMTTATLVALTESCYNAYEYEKAISYGKKCLDVELDDITRGEVRGWILHSMVSADHISDAVQMLQDISAKETTVEAKAILENHIGSLLLNVKRYGEALIAFQNVLGRQKVSDSVKAAAAYNSGICYYQQNDNEAAMRQMRVVIEKFPSSAYARTAKAKMYLWACSLDSDQK